MKIKDVFANRQKPVFSFEFFPPKTEAGKEKLLQAIEELKELGPDYVSVTYGALGSTQDKSLDIVRIIQQDIGLEVMAHYTCIGATKEKVEQFLGMLASFGVENILALRGDAPEGTDIASALADSPFNYACDLVSFIAAESGQFSLGVAGYPEVHPACGDKEQDLLHLKQKVDAGADFVVTQLFFDNADFFDFKKRAEEIGITVPIIPGIMPIENIKQIEKITSLCGAKVPVELKELFARDDISEEEKTAQGVAYTTKQCRELLAAGVRGLHFYTLNKSTATREIFKKLHG